MRMRIVIMTKDGISPSSIAQQLHINYKTAVNSYDSMTFHSFCKAKWAERADEVLQKGSVDDAPRSGPTPKIHTKKQKRAVYNKLKKSTLTQTSK